jgi:hypothetical protein
VSIQHESDVRDLGTKVRLFPQAPFLAGYDEPEIVWLSPPAGTVRPGPADDRMYVVDAIDKTEPYQFPYLPPYYGPAYPPVVPEAGGHLDHLATGTHDFNAVHLYGTVRRVLDIAESFLGRAVPWHFATEYPRMEMIPFIDWENAQSGYGYLEIGCSRDETGAIMPWSLNFDVVAHEVGHLVLFGLSGVPDPQRRTRDFYAYHESIADLTALLSVLHFDTVMDRLLRATKGNLYTFNELNRIAELSDNRQIRLASTSAKLSEVAGSDDPHDRSRPLTGGVFDMLVEIVKLNLLQRGLIDETLSLHSESTRSDLVDSVAAGFQSAYANRHFAFKSALADARDTTATALIQAIAAQPAEDLAFDEFGHRLCARLDALDGGRYGGVAERCLAWREIV